MKNSSNNQLSQEQLNEVAGLIKNNNIVVPRTLKTIDLQDIYHALQNEEISLELAKSTINISDCQNANQVKDFIRSFDNASFKPQSIEVQFSLFSENQMIALAIKTGINVYNDIIQGQPRKKILIEKLYKLLKENNLELEQEKLIKFVEIACQDAKSTDGLAMQYIQALRILSTFDFSEIDGGCSTLQSKFKELYSQQEVKSEVHHLQKAEDLHFYMVKVTGINANEWRAFSKLQFEEIKYSPLRDKLSIGLNAFSPSIGYHDQDLTDTYVAFISNKPWNKGEKINPTSVEMLVTMMTSEHAHFISHAGISRTATYKGNEHKNTSVQLHSFIAACAKDIYGEQKEYMITPPAIQMRDIIINAFAKNKASDKIYIGHQDTPIPKHPVNILEALADHYKEIRDEHFKAGRLTEGNQKDYINTFLDLNLSKQKVALGEKKVPIKLVNSSEGGPGFILYGKNGEMLHNLTSKDMEGEFAWFCKSKYLLSNQSNNEPLLTCDLDTLAKLATPAGSIEHDAYIETIGDAVPYPASYLI